MQTIPLNTRVVVSLDCRGDCQDGEEQWIGTVVAYYSDSCDYLVAFRDFSKGWYTAEQLRVLEPKQLAPVPYCRHGTHPNTPCGACESDD